MEKDERRFFSEGVEADLLFGSLFDEFFVEVHAHFRHRFFESELFDVRSEDPGLAWAQPEGFLDVLLEVCLLALLQGGQGLAIVHDRLPFFLDAKDVGFRKFEGVVTGDHFGRKCCNSAIILQIDAVQEACFEKRLLWHTSALSLLEGLVKGGSAFGIKECLGELLACCL